MQLHLILQSVVAVQLPARVRAAPAVPDWIRAPIVVGGNPGSGLSLATSVLANMGVYMVG